MKWGMSYLGGAQYKAEILANHPDGWGARFFDEEFGDCKDVVKALVDTGRCPMISIQMLWGGRGHSYGDRDVRKIEEKAKKWQKFKQNHPQIEVYLSPFCEHKLRNPDKYLDIVQRLAPDCIVFNSPLPEGAVSNKYRNDFHGADKRPRNAKTPFSFDWDGTHPADSDVEAYKKAYAGAEWFFWWRPQFNLHRTMKPEDGALRNAKPVAFQWDALIYLRNHKGGVDLPQHMTLKPEADQHSTRPETRAGKPVIIFPDVGKITFKARGQVIAEAKPGDLFKESYVVKRRLYRLNDYGYILSEKAKRINGSPIVEIWYKGKRQGMCNLAFRDPPRR